MIPTDWGNTALAFAAIAGLVVWVVYFGMSMAADSPTRPK
jgi:hypothetical protein